VTAGITGATRVYLHLAHPSAHARTPQVMNAELARRGVDTVAISADVTPGDLGGFARGAATGRGGRPAPRPASGPAHAGRPGRPVLDLLGPSGTGQFHDRERFLVRAD
jgi:hypothetical protein